MTAIVDVSGKPFDLGQAIQDSARYGLGKLWEQMTAFERILAIGYAVRNRTIDIALETERRYREANAKRAYYLSLEFLMGRLLGNNLANLGLLEAARQVVRDLGDDLDELMTYEPDAALGNGGLGRLAACFLDSLATLGMPGFGYGLNYHYGMFKQEIRDNYQIEKPDDWLRHGTPWQLTKFEEGIPVQLYGRVVGDAYNPQWVDSQVILGLPHDMPIVGYGGKTVNVLRLFSSRAIQDFDMQVFDEGKYVEALHQRDLVETITKVLYPNDAVPRGYELRLVQQYFLVSCSLRDILRRTRLDNIRQLPDKVAIQMNDTHPSLCVAELMRILVDEYRLDWEEAWSITTRTLSYTNHTLMPEALERWPVRLLERVLPRHVQIIFEINRRHLDEVASRYPHQPDKLRRLSLIEEEPEKRVRMAYLAIVGSHSVNGVAAVHSELIKSRLVPDFAELSPHKFNNKTNGVTQRRWLLLCNPGLARLLTEAVGESWLVDLERVREIERFAEDANFQERFRAIKHDNKLRASRLIRDKRGYIIDPDSLIDSQIKRIHEYKRQMLKALHVVHEYLRIVEDGYQPPVPRTVIVAGKAAPGYFAAKQIIYLINCLGELINRDPACNQHLKVIFAPDYRVTLSELIIPATNLSEQISTAGTEASGTGNMKFAINGALTIGTLDGANIEIREAVGADNFFLFGNRVDEIHQLAAQGVHPRVFFDRSPTIQRVMNAFRTDRLSPGAPGKFAWVFHKLVESWDQYFHLADLDSYLQMQDQASELYTNQREWTRRAILNVARMGKFSSDRTIKEYAREIWDIHPVL
jgi:starch phosphorylase